MRPMHNSLPNGRFQIKSDPKIPIILHQRPHIPHLPLYSPEFSTFNKLSRDHKADKVKENPRSMLLSGLQERRGCAEVG